MPPPRHPRPAAQPGFGPDVRRLNVRYGWQADVGDNLVRCYSLGDELDRSPMTHLLAALLLSLQPSAPPALTPALVLPEDSKPAYRAHSPPDCSDWAAARTVTIEDSRLRFGNHRLWVLGYITGFNIVGPDPSGDLLGAAPHEEVYAAIDGYCSRNPSHSVVDAMHPVAAAFIRRRQGTPAANVSAPGQRRRAMVVAAISCRDWIEARANAIVRLAYVGVLRGYLTAYNRWGPDPTGDAVGGEDRSLIEGAIDEWCRQRPSALLIGAVSPLIAHVAAERAAGRLAPAGMRPNDSLSAGPSTDR